MFALPMGAKFSRADSIGGAPNPATVVVMIDSRAIGRPRQIELV
jgi:hypothetical protein